MGTGSVPNVTFQAFLSYEMLPLIHKKKHSYMVDSKTKLR